MLTHRNMQANLEQAKAAYSPLLKVGHEMVVTALPLYHVFALTVNCLLFIELGGRNLLITNPRDIPGMVRELSRYPFTALTGVNTLFNALLHNEDFRELDFSSLRLSVGGGMPVQKAVAERWEQLTGHHLLEGYGLTECSPLVAGNPYDLKRYSGSIGLPVPSTDVRLVDDEGREVAPGRPESCRCAVRRLCAATGSVRRQRKRLCVTAGWPPAMSVPWMSRAFYASSIVRRT